MSLFSLEKKIRQWIDNRGGRQLQRVSVMRLKISFERGSLVVVIGGRSGNLLRQLRNARVERGRHLQISRGRSQCRVIRRPQLNRSRLGNIRVRLVDTNHALVIEIVDGPAGIDRQRAVWPNDPPSPRGKKKYVGADRLEQHAIMNEPSRQTRRGLTARSGDRG